MTSFRALALVSISALVIAGCGNSSNPPDDGGSCTAGQTVACTCSGGATGIETCSNGAFGACACVSDGGTDAGTDAGTDGGSDAGMDAGSDAGTDAGTDAGADAGTDAGTDGGTDGGADAGNPIASFSTAPLDLGFGGCGVNSSPGSTSLSVRNTGSAPLTYSATLASTQQFTISSASSGTIAAGASASITITAQPVAATASAGQSLATTLTLATNDSTHAMANIAVSLTAQGGVLTLAPANTTFGASNPVDVPAAPSPIVLTNAGNEAVTVSFGAPSNPDFGVTYTNSPTATAIAANGGTLAGLEATFTPTTAANENATVPINVTGPVCAGSATTIILSGTGTNGIFGASTSDIYFGDANGLVPCGTGTKAAAQTFTLSNSGNEVYHFNTALGAGANSNYTVSPSSGQVLPGNSPTTITVTPINTIPAVSATTQDLYSDTLAITTDIANDSNHTINLHQTAKGAILSITPGAYSFGNVPSNSNSVGTFTITNTGNATANVSIASSNASMFAVSSGAGPSAILAGASSNALVTFSPGAMPGNYTSNLSVSAGMSDVLCAPLPGTVALTGTGLSATVAVSTTSLNFGTAGSPGLTNCGTTAPAQTVVFTNTGTLQYTFSAALTRGASSPYTLSNNCSGVVPPKNGSTAGTCTLTVTPQPIPAVSAVTPNLYGDLITITTDASGDSPHYVALSQTAQGAIITGEASSLDFGGISAGSQDSRFVYFFTNTGNHRYDLALTLGNGSPFVRLDAVVPLDANNTRSTEIHFAPSANQTGGYSDKLLLAPQSGSTNTVLCAPLPFLDTSSGTNFISLVGTGTSAKTQQPNAGVDFKTVNCGATTTAPTQSVVFSAGAIPFSYTAKLGKTGSAAIFSIDLTSGTVAADTPLKITVTALPVPQTVPAINVTQHGMDDVLTITTTGIPGDSPHHIFLQKTPGGAVITAYPSTVAMPATKAGTTTTVNGGFVLTNTGTLSATGLTSTLSDTTDFAATVPSSVNSFGHTSVGNVTFQPGTSGTKSGTLTITGTATPLCQPLPAGINLTGTGL